MGKNIEIGLEKYQSTIETTPEEIVIEISGLKSLDSFISLSDTPLYYDNGKFFKVVDNKIVYTDITWADIQGSIAENPDLEQQIRDIAKEYSEDFVIDTVNTAVGKHNEDSNAHEAIQTMIADNYTSLDEKINLNAEETLGSIEKLTEDIIKNADDISTLFEEQAKDIENITKINSDIEIINTSIQDLDKNVDDIISKIENGEIESSELGEIVAKNYEELSGLISENTDNITTNSDNIVLNEEAIKLLRSDLETYYTKTEDLKDVTFTGDYNDLINLPDIPSLEGYATEEYVNNKVVEAISQIEKFDFVVVDELPEVGESNHIYLVSHIHDESNVYDEFIWIDAIQTFEKIGTTDIDLSGYYIKEEVDTLLNAKVDKVEGYSLISDTEIERLSTVDNYDDTEIKQLINAKQDVLTAGDNIVIEDNVVNVVLPSLDDKFNEKADKVSTGATLAYSESLLELKDIDGTTISEVTIKSAPDVDNKTINFNANKELQSVGTLTQNGTYKKEWVGTRGEYDLLVEYGLIEKNVEYHITNDYEDIISILDLSAYSTKEEVNTGLNLKGDGLIYEDGLLYLTSGDKKISEGILVQAGGGGGGGGGGGASMFTLTTITPENIYCSLGDTVEIAFTYESPYNLKATAQYFVNGVVENTSKITSGSANIFDLSKYLKDGYNYIEVVVTDTYGNKDSLIYEINTITLTMTSNFDSSLLYDTDVNFRYTPYGTIEKTIHFVLDGVETTEVVTTSGRQQTKILKLEPGLHTLKLWSTAELNTNTVSSNVLYYEIIYVGGSEIIIASEFNGTKYRQGDNVGIYYNVYDPNALETNVKFYINDKMVSDLSVDRKRQYWNNNIVDYGTVTIKIEAGDKNREFVIEVEKVDIDVEAVTENLQLYLTANNRSNNDVNKNEWKYNDIECTLSNFNFVNNGWVNNALKVSNGARVTIPMKIFQGDFRSNGKTIEIEFSTSNVLDYNSTLISCMSGNKGFVINAQDAMFKSEQSEVKVKFKEDEKVRLGFVVENKFANKLIYTYLNGILSGIAQYPEDDDFSQVTPVDITIGSDTCDINIYNIRVYDFDLSHYDILNNFIADTFNIDEKIKLYARNDIYDSFGNVLYNKLLKQVPIMTITGELPPVKGDKKIVDITYENSLDESRNFTMRNVTLDIQGTSSQYYPKKNYKISKMPDAYSLRENSVPEKLFTLKADYMESSHAHNTGMAKFVNDIYSVKVPPQENKDNIRTTIDGFPIAVFYRANASSQPVYFGVYNFNNDKVSNDTFGFTSGCESWEFCNNTSDRCLFKSDDFSNSTDVLTDFEARYPDGNKDYSNLQDLITWVVECYNTENGVTKFKNECEQHFNLNYLLTYYVLSEFFGMVDSRAKNLFLNTYGDGIWYTVFYDMDTMIGLNNEGVNEFDFSIEYHDTIGTQNVFNAEKSGLWNLVEQAYPTEINELYNELRNNKLLTYERVMEFFYNQQIAQICEAQYNADADFKYISPLVQDNIATYLYTAQGSRIDHIKWWVYNRFKYLDSKYIASDYKSNYLTLRLYTPDEWSEVEPNADITLTTYSDQYVRIKYGSYEVYDRASKNETVTLTPPPITFNDTETIVYGADRITAIGDLSPLYAGTIDVSSAVKLTELKIGEGGTYSNTNLKSLTLGNNILLQTLDVRNCPLLTGALDISGCTNIKEIDTTGTSLTSVKLANAGSITKLLLPETIVNLTVKNQNSISEFTCGNALTTIVIENSNLDSKSIFEQNTPEKVRFTNIDWTVTDLSLLDKAYNILGVDENGNNTTHGVITGVLRIDTIKESILNEYKKKFIGLQFIVGSYTPEDYVCTDFGEIITTDRGERLLYT